MGPLFGKSCNNGEIIERKGLEMYFFFQWLDSPLGA
jgi:hypothetical protein